MAFLAVILMVAFSRFGLVASISVVFINHSFTVLPLTFNTTSILFPQTVITLIILFGIMAYAAYISIGGAKMFGEKSFLGD